VSDKPPYLIEKSKTDDTAVYFKKVQSGSVELNDPQIFTFPVAAKQEKVLIGVVGTPYQLPFEKDNPWSYLGFIAWGLFLLILFGVGAIVLWKIAKGGINIKEVLSESDGKASLSRFQAFLFTFVFVIGVMLILIRTGDFPTDIPLSVLAILGGSLGTYLISKGIGDAGTASTPPPSGTAPSRGPLLRWSPTFSQFPVNPSDVKSLSSGSAHFVLPTIVGEPQQYTVVAVAVGEIEFVLRPRVSSRTGVNGKMRYIDPRGNVQTTPFSVPGDFKVPKIPDNKITEIGVAFSSETTGVPVELEVAQS
jgi:hypothetical protein